MEFSIPPLSLYAASWVTITGGVWALFERAETVLESRYVIRWMARKPSIGRIFLLTAFDLVATAVIASLIFLTIGWFTVTPTGKTISIGFKEIMRDTLTLSSKYGPIQTIDVFFETGSGAIKEVRPH